MHATRHILPIFAEHTKFRIFASATDIIQRFYVKIKKIDIRNSDFVEIASDCLKADEFM